ncbi:MAG: tetratricopeptide repeat protein [Flammeovirgaceae bacterium]
MKKTYIQSLCFLVFLLFISLSAFSQDDPYHRFINNGIKLSRMQQYNAAIKEFELALAISDTSAQVFYYKGLGYFSMRDAKNAIVAFEEALVRDPKHIDALSKLLTCYKKNRDLENTIKTFDRMFAAVDDPKKKVMAKLSSIRLLSAEDKYDSALLYVNHALEVDPKHVELLYYKGKLLNLEGKYEEAKTNIDAAIMEFEGRDIKMQTQLNYELGYALHKLGKYKESSVAFRNANYGPYKSKVALFSPSYYHLVAVAHNNILDYDRALELVTIAVAMDSTFEQAILLKEKVEKSMTDRSKEVEAYKRVLNKDMDELRRYDLYKTSITALIGSKKYRDAVVLADSCIARYKEKQEPYFLKSIALYKNNFKEDAITLLNNLLKEETNTREDIGKYNFQLGLIHLYQKEMKKAEDFFDKVIKGGSKYARAALFEKNLISGQ